MNPLLIMLLKAIGVVFATTLHEFVRAVTSTILGDKKPKNDGRLSINPIKHFEPIGFILCFLTGFGWGQPVQTNAMFYKDRKRDTLITAILPSVANIVFAIAISIIAKSIDSFGTVTGILFQYIIYHNIALAIYNIIPVSPMDGVRVLSTVMPANTYFKYIQYEKVIQMVFLLLLFLGYVDIIFSPIINFFIMIMV